MSWNQFAQHALTLNAEKLSNIVRSASMSETATQRSGLTTPTPWDLTGSRGSRGSRPPSHEDGARSVGRETYQRDNRDVASQRERVERLTTGSRPQHARHDSGATGAASSGDYTDGHAQSTGRKHDYDVQAMESDLSPRPGAIKNPIPAPLVTVRSEFPTLNRSRQQQPLTCLVTVEVPDGHWRPDMDDLRFAPPNAPLPSEDVYSPVRPPPAAGTRPPAFEPQANLDEIAEELRLRVENWHGLEFQRSLFYSHRHCR